jgi:hypothetical protein
MKYPCSTIDVAPLIDYATTFHLQTKTRQKPYAKTPQKTHKNPAKIFYKQTKNL